MLPFSICTTGAGSIGGGGVRLGGIEALDAGRPGGMRLGGGGEQQPPQLLQDRGAVLLATPYGFIADQLLFDTLSTQAQNPLRAH